MLPLSMEVFAVSIGILGAAVGYLVGVRTMPSDRSAPTVLAAALGTIFYLVAYTLLVIAIVLGGCTLIILFFRHVWPTIRESMVEFSRQSGIRWRTLHLGGRTNTFDRIQERLHWIDGEISEVDESGMSAHEKRVVIEKLEEDKTLLQELRESLF